MNQQAEATQALIEIGQFIASRNWCPATGGNFSARLGAEQMLVTTSGKDKGMLTEADLLRANLYGEPLEVDKKPSAETLLHARLYQLDSEIGCVLHTHSVASTTLSLLLKQETLRLENYEMQKSLQGIRSHEQPVAIEIFDNTQDMQALAEALSARWQKNPLQYGFLVRGHGLYAWGETPSEAKRHIEGLEFLFACELERIRITGL